jgi:hypothetical protein
MWISRIHYGLLLPFVLVVAGAVTFGSASAQSDAKLKELNQRVIELHSAGKYREAIPIAEEYVTAVATATGTPLMQRRSIGWPSCCRRPTGSPRGSR